VSGYDRHRPGIYRRRILIRSQAGQARADMEDDPHRYGVEIRHDGERVTAIREHMLRTPWDLCRQAGAALQRLVGMPLSADATAIFRHTAASEQCTHMFDTAGLAIAHAARGIARRQYDVEAPYWQPSGPRQIRLSRDGEPLLEWTIDDQWITAPAPYAGQRWQKLLSWAREHIGDADALEAVVVLRRAVMISHGRTVSLDTIDNAAATGHVNGACHVFTPGIAERARRIYGSTLDFTDTPDALLADLESQEPARPAQR
jgi:hypothetical protein